MSTETGRNTHNSNHNRRFESPAIIVIKGNINPKEQNVANVRPSLAKNNKIKNPSAIPENITSMNQLNLFLAIALVIGNGMV